MDKRFIAYMLTLFAATFFIFYYMIYPSFFQPKVSDAQRAANACVLMCAVELHNGRNLSAGPCISDEIIPGWVCDVAHKPRQDIDNLPENQCPAYSVNATHFVEVDPQCNFIRAV